MPNVSKNNSLQNNHRVQSNNGYLTTTEAAKELGYTRQWISHLYRKGELLGIRSARDILLVTESVSSFKSLNPTHRITGRKPHKVSKQIVVSKKHGLTKRAKRTVRTARTSDVSGAS